MNVKMFSRTNLERHWKTKALDTLQSIKKITQASLGSTENANRPYSRSIKTNGP